MRGLWLRGGLAGIALCLAAFLAFLLIKQVGTRPPPESVSSDETELADAGIQGFRYQQTQSGMVQWEVEAERAQVFESQHRAVLEVVQVQLYGQNARKMIVKAEHGTINTRTNNFDLKNEKEPIVVKLNSGYTIFTPHLRWVDGRQEIRTTEVVLIQGHGLKITGKGLVGNLNDEEFTILDDVRVEIAS